MLCDTCKYSDADGYCGQGRALTGTHYDECSTYQYGEKAEAPSALPGWLSLIMNSERVLLDNMSFPVKGHWENHYSIDLPPRGPNGYNGYKWVRPSKYTILLLPEQTGYEILAHHIRDHIYMMEWGPCRLSIDTMYTTVHLPTHGYAPIVICMSFHHMDKHPWYEQVDLGSYVWWLDPDVPPGYVELFLLGLMALHNLHYHFIEHGAYYKPLPSTGPVPDRHAEPSVYMNQVIMLSPTGIYTQVPPPNTGYTYHESTHRRLVDDYMKGTKDFPKLPIKVAQEYYRYWLEVIRVFSTNLL
ncbi:hypothetical protein [Microcoleus phage My-WqHQDG]|nr:hypothetical protein [Microcoleus phage My-WqHQDG]